MMDKIVYCVAAGDDDELIIAVFSEQRAAEAWIALTEAHPREGYANPPLRIVHKPLNPVNAWR